MATYAAKTDVPVARSRDEIESTVTRYGATKFAYMTEPGQALVSFVANNRMVRFIVPLPDPNERRFTHHSRGTRTVQAARSAWEQACRQKWRALSLIIKANLEAVESGIVAFEDAFMPYTVLPSGRTVSEELGDAISLSIESGNQFQITDGKSHG